MEGVTKRRHDKDIQTKLTEVPSTDIITRAVVNNDGIMEDGNILFKGLPVDVDKSTSSKRKRKKEDKESESLPLKKIRSSDVNETFTDDANTDRQSFNEVLSTSRKKNRSWSDVVKEKTTGANDTETPSAVKDNLSNNDSECTEKWNVVNKRKKRSGPYDKSHFQQTCTLPYVKKPVSTEQVTDLVTTYTVNYQTESIPCLKVRADISQSEKTPDVFFRDGEVTVTKSAGKDKFEDLKLCTIFDDNFVKVNKNSFKTFWEQVLKYVIEKKQMIDLHGMSEPIAKAAVEFAVTRVRHNNKDLLGRGFGSNNTLTIVTGQGKHSSGSAVLCKRVEEHLLSLKCKRVKTPPNNPGLFEVDTRYKI